MSRGSHDHPQLIEPRKKGAVKLARVFRASSFPSRRYFSLFVPATDLFPCFVMTFMIFSLFQLLCCYLLFIFFLLLCLTWIRKSTSLRIVTYRVRAYCLCGDECYYILKVVLSVGFLIFSICFIRVSCCSHKTAGPSLSITLQVNVDIKQNCTSVMQTFIHICVCI